MPTDAPIKKAPAKKQPALPAVRLTHPNRVLYSEQGITKLDLANYYAQIAEWILPHVKGRPLSIVRCPAGLQSACFFQKHLPKGQAGDIRQVQIQEKQSIAAYLVADNIADLVWLVQIGVLEIHVWGSRADQVERPDRLVFDLDPDPAVPWTQVREGAKLLRDVLADLGLASFLKTTGGKGLHVVVPVERRYSWPEAKRFSKAVADLIANQMPARYVVNMSKAARRGKIFIDYLRNERGATSIAPYSTRARKGAPVATPIAWEELDAVSDAAFFTLKTVPRRLARLRRDPWADMDQTRQGISAEAKRKLGLS